MEMQKELLEMQRLIGEAVTLAGQGRGRDLSPLLAQMQALAQILPINSGLAGSSDEGLQSEARRLAREAEIEQGFDNMPV